MEKVNDGFMYGVDVFNFNKKPLGYISEEGLAWGGDKPEKVKINAAQIKSGPVKVITKNSGSQLITFKLIQLKGENCKDVMGGEVAADGSYTPPAKLADLEAVADIKCDSGHTIRVFKGSLSAKPAGNINGSEVLALECELEMLVPDGGGAPYKIFPPGVTPPDEPAAEPAKASVEPVEDPAE